MPNFNPTPEQFAIIEFARDHTENLLVSALAGAAKTSTLVMIAEALPKKAILCLAFNKKIADEMKTRLPDNCTSSTLNSLGHRAWSTTLGRKLTLDMGKTYRLVRDEIDKLGQKDKELTYDAFQDLMKAVNEGKSSGYIPDGFSTTAKPLMDDEAFFESLEWKASPLEQRIIRNATSASLKEAMKGTIDFSDQLLMPTCFTAFFDSFPVVMVDEAQDLSALNHVLLHKLIGKKGRLIAVGDQCQSIYGFRGAHEEGMQVLAEEFAMTELRLSISFRCPINIVCEAQWRAPHMRWPDWALPGTVHRAPSWSILDIPEDAAIICRNNAPLFTTAIRLLKNGRYPELVGNDIGKNLMKTMAKFGNKNVSREALLTCIDRWEAEKKNKSRAPKRISDQAECMRIFARQGKTLGDAIAYGEHILAAAGPVKLMTGHKSKGLEFNHVFFLDEFLLGDEGQELNLKYVIQTRSKSTLTYITSDGFTEEGFTDA